MKTKSLTCLIAVALLSACHGHSSAAFSSSSESLPPSTSASSQISSSSELSSSSSEESSSIISSSSSQKQHKVVHYYNDYYSSLIEWSDGEDLKNQLHAIIRNGYTPISYTASSIANWKTNSAADHSKYYFENLDIVYSETDINKSQTQTGWQREHAFCASLMCGSLTADAVKQKGRATDFHNLFAAEASANGSRGNKNYGNADKSATNYTDRTTKNGYDGYSYSANFEPGGKDKGRLARAIFYMATMYKDDEEDLVNNITMKGLRIVENPVDYIPGEEGNFAHGNLSHLLEWNKDYDVDYLEMQHNVAVYTSTDNLDGVAQGNRNPYVDFPELVDYVYGDKKDSPGALENLFPSCIYLDCEDDSISHYALKEAKRVYGYNETVSPNDYKVVAVNRDYTYSLATEGITHSLEGHVFSSSDGDVVNAEITTPTNRLAYQITLNPMFTCSTGIIYLDKATINDKTPNEEQAVKWGDYDFYFCFTTSYGEVSTKGMTLSNDNVFGSGFYLGSGTKTLTGVTIKTKESYTIDQAYIKTYAGNQSSNFNLTIKVGDQVLMSATRVTNNSAVYKMYGASVSTPLTGQLTFIFTGSNALRLNSIAFNVVNV